MAVPTSEERRDVAWRLRTEVSESECIDYAVFRIINGVLGVNGAWGAKAARILADMIDPTCHVVTTGERRGRPIGSACSVCHAPLYPSTAWAHGMRYCSQCGARIVDDVGGDGE